MTQIASRTFNLAACAFAGFSLCSSEALGAGAAGPTLAVPTSDDVASYIMRVGGWLSQITIDGDTGNHYWTQVSYSVSDKAPTASTIGTTSILIITVTRSILMKSALGNSPAVPCSQGETITQTITFDPRDISVKDVTETASPPAHAKPNDPTMPLSTPALWKVNFSVSPLFSKAKPSVVRQVTTVALPTCMPMPTGPWDTSTSQSDSSGFSIEFAKKDQADYLMALIKAAWIDMPWPPDTASN